MGLVWLGGTPEASDAVCGGGSWDGHGAEGSVRQMAGGRGDPWEGHAGGCGAGGVQRGGEGREQHITHLKVESSTSHHAPQAHGGGRLQCLPCGCGAGCEGVGPLGTPCKAVGCPVLASPSRSHQQGPRPAPPSNGCMAGIRMGFTHTWQHPWQTHARQAYRSIITEKNRLHGSECTSMTPYDTGAGCTSMTPYDTGAECTQAFL